MNLYELQQGYAQLDLLLTESEGEITIEIQDLIDALSEDKDKILEGIAVMIKNSEAEAEALTNEAKKLTERKRKLEQKVETLKKATFNILPEWETWTHGPHKLSWRRSEAVEVFAQDKIPNQYWIETYSRSVDKKALKEALKADRASQIPGAELITNWNLQIK